jgi:histidinol-phosphatase (PHP family)
MSDAHAEGTARQAVQDDADFLHNFHTHTFRCKHATGDAADYCAEAVARGMRTLGFSDHTALPDDRWQRERMSYAQLDDYVAAVNAARADHPSLRVLLGMECEYVPQMHAYYEDELFGARSVDYLVGGPHYFERDGKFVGTYGGTRDAAALRDYAAYLVSMIDSGLFDFIAHPDLFGNCYRDWDADTIACSRDIIAAAKARGVALEVNALGLRKIAHRKADNPYPLYPWLPFWELAAEEGADVIVNSDAHRPQDLQSRTAEAHAIVARLGLRHVAPTRIGTRGR